MDYAGLDYRNLRYPVDRTLTASEQENRFDPKRPSGFDPSDYLSVIRLNSTLLELVDRWYHIKGFNVWLGSVIAVLSLCLFGAIVWAFFYAPAEAGEEWVLWVLLLLLGPVTLFLAWGGIWLVRTEAFRFSHYPIRLNRVTRQVHVFRQNGTVLTTPWSSLHVVVGESSTPPLGATHDLRAHVLAEDGTTVKESFSLGYTWPAKPDSMSRFWEFIRRYMEEPDGVNRTHDQVEFCLPVHDRKEGFAFGVMRTFAPGGHWPILQLLFSIPFSLNALGRWAAMSTSRIPRWPAEVEAVNVVAADDPYRKDWRKNPVPNFREKGWPLICCLIGWAAIAFVVWWLFTT